MKLSKHLIFNIVYVLILHDYLVVFYLFMLYLVGYPCDPTSIRCLCTDTAFALAFIEYTASSGGIDKPR